MKKFIERIIVRIKFDNILKINRQRKDLVLLKKFLIVNLNYFVSYL